MADLLNPYVRTTVRVVSVDTPKGPLPALVRCTEYPKSGEMDLAVLHTFQTPKELADFAANVVAPA